MPLRIIHLESNLYSAVKYNFNGLTVFPLILRSHGYLFGKCRAAHTSRYNLKSLTTLNWMLRTSFQVHQGVFKFKLFVRQLGTSLEQGVCVFMCVCVCVLYVCWVFTSINKYLYLEKGQKRALNFLDLELTCLWVS